MPKLAIVILYLLLSQQSLAQLPSNSPPLIHHKNNFAINAFVAWPNTHADVGIAYALSDRLALSAKFMIRPKAQKSEYAVGISSISLRYYRSVEEKFIYGANFDLGLGGYQWLGNAAIFGTGPAFNSGNKGETNAKSIYTNLSIYGGLQLKKFMFISSIGVNRNDYFEVTGETFQNGQSLKRKLNNDGNAYYSMDYSFAVRYGVRKVAFEIFSRGLYRSKEPALTGIIGCGIHLNLQGPWRINRNDG